MRARLALLLLVSPLFAPSAGAQDCVASPEDLARHLGAAWSAFGEMDLAGFAAGRDAASAAIPCLTRPIDPQLAANWHTVMALDAFTSEDPVATGASFRAALECDPAFDLPDAFAPEGSPLRTAFEDARTLAPSPRAPVSVPPGWLLFVDGARTVTRPTRRPAVYQWLDPDGVDRYDGYLAGDEPVPSMVPVSASAAVDRRGSVPMLVAASGAVVVSAAFFVAASASRATFEDPGTHRSELEPLQRRTNAFVVVYTSAGALAVGLGVVGVLW